MTKLAMRVVRSSADAEDVVQDAFLSALTHLDDFDPNRSFRPWLSRIVVNRALDLVNSRGVRGATQLSEALPAGGPSPAQQTERNELAEQVRRVIATMPPRQRLIVELYDLQGASVAEIAAMTGSAQATVRWHLHIGRRAIKQALSHLYGEAE